MKSDGNLAGYQAAVRHSSASWRKKDSRFVRPTNLEARDKGDYRDRVRRQDERKADIKPQKKVSVSSDTSLIHAGKAPESCNYRHTFYFERSLFNSLCLLSLA